MSLPIGGASEESTDPSEPSSTSRWNLAPLRGLWLLSISVDFEGHGLGRLLVPLVVRREAEKEMPANVAAFKQRMEAQRSTNEAAAD